MTFETAPTLARWLLGILCVTLGACDHADLPDDYVLPEFNLTVVDDETGRPVNGAVVQLSWELEPVSNEKTEKNRGFRQLRIGGGYTDAAGHFWYHRSELARPKGWALVAGQDPLVRIYVPGYRRRVLENRSSDGAYADYIDQPSKKAKVAAYWSGKTVRLKPLKRGRPAQLEELSTLREDIESGISSVSETYRTMTFQYHKRLLILLLEECEKLADEQRDEVCFEPDSEFAVRAAEFKAARTRELQRKEWKPVLLRPRLDVIRQQFDGR